jgi:hypothetical protein
LDYEIALLLRVSGENSGKWVAWILQDANKIHELVYVDVLCIIFGETFAAGLMDVLRNVFENDRAGIEGAAVPSPVAGSPKCRLLRSLIKARKADHDGCSSRSFMHTVRSLR